MKTSVSVAEPVGPLAVESTPEVDAVADASQLKALDDAAARNHSKMMEFLQQRIDDTHREQG